jgi:hypothetical protein
MSFEELQNRGGYLGAPIAKSALWRPTPVVKLGKQENAKVLFWKWHSEEWIEDFDKPWEGDDFFTTARPVDQKVLRRGKETLGGGG